MLLLLSLLAVAANLNLSHHILVFHGFGSKSNLLLFAPLMEELLDRGNRVTSILFSSVGIEHENLTEIVLPTDTSVLTARLSNLVMQKPGFSFQTFLVLIQIVFYSGLGDRRLWSLLYDAATWDPEPFALESVRPPEVQELIRQKPKVDAVVTQWATGALFAEVFDCPVVLFSPNGPFLTEGTNLLINRNLQPLLWAPFIEPMSLMQQLANNFIGFAMDHLLGHINHQFYLHQAAFLQKELGLVVRSADLVLQERVSVMLAASHPVTHGAWPFLPNIIEVGGLHLRPARQLPNNLQMVLDNATRGAVLVSFGSTIKAEEMSLQMVKLFLEVFRMLELPVIWQWEGVLVDPPANLLTMPWLPQQDLLAHPNLKVLVTHGGLGSLTEAIQHKVVVVGIPLTSDQQPNMLRAERLGYGIKVDWNSLSVDQLLAAITKALRDPEMQQNVEKVRSWVFKGKNLF